MNSYPFEIQRDMVICCFIFHNFIRRNRLHKDIFDEDCNIDEVDVAQQFNEEAGHNQINLNNWRDDIATTMWNDYENRFLKYPFFPNNIHVNEY